MIKATFNQLCNVKNSFQTTTPRVLCLCSAGLLRSPTMANVFHQRYGWNTRAAGVTSSYALIPVSEALLAWADRIVCANDEVFSELISDSHQKGVMDKMNIKVTILDLPDQYEWDSPELCAEIITQMDKELEDKGQ